MPKASASTKGFSTLFRLQVASKAVLEPRLKLASVGSSNDATLSSEAVSNEGEDTSVGNVLTEAAFVPLTFVVTLGWWVSRKKRQVQGVESVPERTSPPNR